MLLNKRKIFAGVLSLVMIGTMISGCSANNSVSNGSTEKLSGSITLYTSQPEEDIQKLVEKFNEKQPDITVNVFRSGTEEVVSKVQAEKQANAMQADVLLVADAVTFESLKADDILASYESPELDGISSEFYDAEHTYTGTKVISTGIMVNTDMVKEPVTSFSDLTREDLKGNTIIPSPLYSGAAAYNLSVLTRTDGLGWDYFQKLKDNGVTVDKGNGTVQKAITGGQKAAGMIVDYMALRSKAEGAPVDFVYPEEGSLIVTEPVGIVKNCANEEQAKAFVDFILSEDGQKATAKIGYTPIKEGVEAPEGFKTVSEIKNLTQSMDTLVQNRETDKEKFSQMFN